MNISSFKTPPLAQVSFQKKLKAKGSVLRDNKPLDCYIYQLEKGKDDDYFSPLLFDSRWQRASFLRLYNSNEPCFDKDKTYVLEDEYENCLGCCIAEEKEGIEFNFLEKIPGRNGYGYIGETIISFLAQNADLKNKDYIKAKSVTCSAKNFYARHDFEFKKDPYTYVTDGYLQSKDFDKIIDANEKHTGKKIRLIV